MRPSRAIATCLATAMLLAPGSVPAARQAESAGAAGIPVHFENQDLSRIVQTLGRATGERFIYGDDLRGRVTVTVPGRVSREEALELLNAMLYLRGFAVLPIADGFKKIVALAETSGAAPFVTGSITPDGEKIITTLVRLKSAQAESVVGALGTYVPSAGVVLASPPTNSIIMAGSESQLRRLISIAQILDRAAEENLMIRAIRYRSAAFVADLIDEVFNQTVVSANWVDIWTDERTNRVIVQAAPDRIEEIHEFIDEVDHPIQTGGYIQVVRILNRDVDDVAQILRGLVANSPRLPRRGSDVEFSPQFSSQLSGRDYSIIVDQATRSLLIRSDPETFELLSEVISKVDKIPPRVSIELIIFQLSRPSSYTFGIDYLLPLTTPRDATDLIAWTESRPSGGSSELMPGEDTVLFARYGRSPLIFTFETDDGTTISIPVSRESVSVQAGEHSFESSVLMRPHLVTISGEESEFFVGNNIPIPVAAGSQTGGQDDTATQLRAGVTNRQTIERQDVGLRLRLTPTLGEASDVLLKIDLEISDIGPPIGGDPARVGVSLEERTVSARIRLSEGEFAVIGSSEQRTEAFRARGIPWLMDIPFFGYLFKRIDKRWVDTTLVIVVQAHILRSPSDDIAETIRRRMAFERSLARVSDLGRLSDAPYALRIDTVLSESMATRIAEAFSVDGFDTRVIPWQAFGQPVWDVYLIEMASFEEVGGLARVLTEAGWRPEITVLSRENELAGD